MKNTFIDLALPELSRFRCSNFEIEDCSGNCSPIEWLGDGACDDGVYEYNGQSVDFNCEELNYDEGDCAYLFADNDGDGFTEDIDCDDDNPGVNPGADEIPNDGINNDCDENTKDDDGDQDGHVTAAVNNFRFNESPLDLLRRASEAGVSEVTLPREWGDWATRAQMPSLRIPDFHMSSVSQAQ